MIRTDLMDGSLGMKCLEYRSKHTAKHRVQDRVRRYSKNPFGFPVVGNLKQQSSGILIY
jgi:hypothetical protein